MCTTEPIVDEAVRAFLANFAAELPKDLLNLSSRLWIPKIAQLTAADLLRKTTPTARRCRILLSH
jgi:hypothetical protein